MQNADTVLAVIRNYGAQRKPLERVYRLLFNRDLFLLAYGRIAKNTGALTPGVTTETADGMSLAKIDSIIEALRFERYQWKPARRVYIEKKNSHKKRPLGIPTWSDILVQEVIRLILEAYYEPQFSDHSHGFRPNRGCHTALREIYHNWRGTNWFIEGDIAQYFDSLDHQLMLDILGQNIRDGRFLALLNGLLEAGYLEDWKFNRTPSGTPQGGVVSPILANIYLDRFDQWVEKTLLPAHNYGIKRKENPVYFRLQSKANWLHRKGQHVQAQQLRRQYQRTPSKILDDADFRRLRYCRYADDFLLSFVGTHSEAEEIKQRIGEFLRNNLKLELSETKTLLTHARSQKAHFLGYEISIVQDDNIRTSTGRRCLNGLVSLKVPMEVVRSKSAKFKQDGKPIHRLELVDDSVYSIITRYQQEYRGIVNYYRLAHNLHRLEYLKWVMEKSLTKTLARKLRITANQVYDKFATVLQTPNGPYKGLQVIVPREGKKPLVAKWGGISLKHNIEAVIEDELAPHWISRTELEKRLLAEKCELCGATENIEVHHIRAMKDLNRPGRAEKPDWVKLMVARQRKTLILCRTCHMATQYGQPMRHRKTE